MNTLILSFLVFILIREIMHYFQVNKLQELLKTNTLREYYSAKKGEPNSNKLAKKEPNKIAYDDPDFDISKVNEVTIDGQKTPVRILN